MLVLTHWDPNNQLKEKNEQGNPFKTNVSKWIDMFNNQVDDIWITRKWLTRMYFLKYTKIIIGYTYLITKMGHTQVVSYIDWRDLFRKRVNSLSTVNPNPTP